MRIRRSYRYFKTNTQQQRNYKKWKKLTKNLLSELWKNYNFCKIHNSYYNKIVFKEEEELTTTLKIKRTDLK
tara:strand:- start:1668 stop:1883 length:216 start_codon:yes stop_codon:yes gene_type:complete